MTHTPASSPKFPGIPYLWVSIPNQLSSISWIWSVLLFPVPIKNRCKHQGLAAGPLPLSMSTESHDQWMLWVWYWQFKLCHCGCVWFIYLIFAIYFLNLPMTHSLSYQPSNKFYFFLSPLDELFQRFCPATISQSRSQDAASLSGPVLVSDHMKCYPFGIRR